MKTFLIIFLPCFLASFLFAKINFFKHLVKFVNRIDKII